MNDPKDYKKLENEDIPIYAKEDIFPWEYIVRVDDLKTVAEANSDHIFTEWEAKFYHFFESHKEFAFNLGAFVDQFFGEEEIINEERVEKTLNNMVINKHIKGTYNKGRYFYHL